MSNIVENFSEAIGVFIDKKLESLAFDKTIVATIV
jgi:hypothetical protein